MYSTKYVLKENISEKTFPVQQVEYKERTAHLPVEPSFLCVFLIFFLIFLFLKKCFFSFYHLINTVNILCNILHIFYTDQICFFATAYLDLLRQNKLCRRAGTAGNNCLAFFQSPPMLGH